MLGTGFRVVFCCFDGGAFTLICIFRFRDFGFDDELSPSLSY